MNAPLTKCLNDDWAENCEFFEYVSAANPRMPKIDVQPFEAGMHENCTETTVLPLDLSESLQTPYPATGPNLLANFIHINAGESLALDTHASSQVFYVIRGSGRTRLADGELTWKGGDYFVLPFVDGIELSHDNI